MRPSEVPGFMPADATSLKQLQTIIDVQARLADAVLDVNAFMQEVVDAAERLTMASGAVVELVDGADMVYRCASGRFASFLGLRLKRNGSLSGLCVAERRVLRCDDTETDQRVDREACRKIGVGSMICTPLFERGAPIGVLKVMAGEPRRFTQYDVQTLRLIAGALGAALGKQLTFDAKNKIEAELRESRARLELSESRMRTFLRQANDAVIAMDARGTIMEWNDAAERMFGWTAQEAAGQNIITLIVPPHLHTVHREEVEQFLVTGQSRITTRRVELTVLKRTGEELQVELSLSAVRVTDRWEFLGLLHDISERKQFEQRLQQLAIEDSLTGLANRRGLVLALERALLRAQRHDHAFALFYMDLNGFKKINDRHGHQGGDQALQEFAQRLTKIVRR